VHSIDRACKFNQSTVTCRLDDAAAILRNLGINETRRYALSAARVPSSSTLIRRL
jgi:hypothetical protein